METKPKCELDEALLAQGVRYDEKTDEYVHPDGHRIAREEWHEVPPGIPGADSSEERRHEPVTRSDLQPRNMREKMSVWFDQDVIDELRRVAAATPGAKMARLINDALRGTYLPDTIPSSKTAKVSGDDIGRLWEKVRELESRLNKTSKTGT